MSDQMNILQAYHRAVARERERTGISWPIVREACIQDDGVITDTNQFAPAIVGRWKLDSLGRPRVTLV